MVRSSKMAVTCIVAGMFMLMSIDANAWYGSGEKRERRGDGAERFAEELGLTPEQKETLKAGKEEAKANHEAIRKNLDMAREALREELGKTEVDKAALDKAVSDIKAAEGELVDSRVNSFLSMKEVLTAEQFQKMSEMKGKRGDKRGKRPGKRMKGDMETCPEAE